VAARASSIADLRRGPRPEKHAADFAGLVDILGPEKALATLAAREDDGLTVDQLAERFFEWKAGDVTERTLADYTNWIKRDLGWRMAESIDELDVQRLVDEMRKRLEPKSIADRHMLLFSMFKFGSARTRRLVSHNPCTETQLPKRLKKPAKGVTLTEYHAIITGREGRPRRRRPDRVHGRHRMAVVRGGRAPRRQHRAVRRGRVEPDLRRDDRGVPRGRRAAAGPRCRRREVRRRVPVAEALVPDRTGG
jgi:hypothetical protein